MLRRRHYSCPLEKKKTSLTGSGVGMNSTSDSLRYKLLINGGDGDGGNRETYNDKLLFSIASSKNSSLSSLL